MFDKKAYDAKYYATHKTYHAAYKIAHKTEINARNAVYREAHKAEAAAYRETHRAEQAAYRAAHQGERVTAYGTGEAARLREWKANHPEATRFHRFQYRVRKKTASGNDYLTLPLLESRWAFYGNRCYLCGAQATETDHVKPLSKGGSQFPCNLRPICRICNSIKKNKWPYDFAAHRARLRAEGRIFGATQT